MESLVIVATFILGLLVRIGLPVGLTLVVMRWLSRLDRRWQSEAEKVQNPNLAVRALASNPGCWNQMNCSEKQRSACRAYATSDKPCWQVFRSGNGALQEKCLGCEVFKHAPIPVSI